MNITSMFLAIEKGNKLKFRRKTLYRTMYISKNKGKGTLTTLEAVPPGQEASNIKPTDKAGGSANNLLMTSPSDGIIVYWATQPASI